MARRVRRWPPFIAVGGLDRDVARLGQDVREEGVEVVLRRDNEQACHRSLSAKQRCYRWSPPAELTALGGSPLPPCLAEGAVHMVDRRHDLLRLGQRGRG